MLTRRNALQLGAALLTLPSLARGQAPEPAKVIKKPIPSSGEMLPVVGMGTSRTFDVPANEATLDQLREVMAAFFSGGGSIIDSSPMYGEAESRVGDVLRGLATRPPVFAATKVWTEGRDAGIAQMEESAERMDVAPLDLVAVHNLMDWKTHLATLKAWKEEGKVRYFGITTSHGRYHRELLEIMRNEPLDFVQFSYNIADRTAEEELLPLARERGIATMINRPYQRGELFGATSGKELPGIAGELGCDSWGQFFLKFILGHPAVTCVIPATSKPHHMVDNIGANTGLLPDEQQRAEMLRAFESVS